MTLSNNFNAIFLQKSPNSLLHCSFPQGKCFSCQKSRVPLKRTSLLRFFFQIPAPDEVPLPQRKLIWKKYHKKPTFWPLALRNRPFIGDESKHKRGLSYFCRGFHPFCKNTFSKSENDKSLCKMGLIIWCIYKSSELQEYS